MRHRGRVAGTLPAGLRRPASSAFATRRALSADRAGRGFARADAVDMRACAQSGGDVTARLRLGLRWKNKNAWGQAASS